ncbi:Integrin alpha-4 like [Heracleum sosnowskyi]|uniref:Integrin alpha-4 like n=1 Tax=Heracleum sosnowskyi TaxID=360622 RepID=A0AAD8J5F5_9APIA|nr:Integrin alpha-4 like [Heracleum sosnowskyi]
MNPKYKENSSNQLTRGKMENKTWADQWGSGGFGDDYENTNTKTRLGGGKPKSRKMEGVKAAASTGIVKAKTVAIFSAKKMKTGTSIGIKWVKRQYKKKFSK